MEHIHYPVMYKEVAENLALSKKKIVVDCTVGLGSHAFNFLQSMDNDAFLIGIDKDEDSLHIARRRLMEYADRARLFREDYRNIDRVLERLGIERADIFFFDLGISTYQLSDSQRGFSFMKEGPLDMRMDKNSFLCAYDLVNHLSEPELTLIFKKFGEERYSRRIAHFLVERRKGRPIMSTTQLRNLVLDAMPRKQYAYRIHPATRVFQALRIAVNRELDSLETGLHKALEYLSPGGRIGVISFHSLEDRITKHTFREYARAGIVSLVTKKPLFPSGEEVKENNPSRSAKLRVVEKIL